MENFINEKLEENFLIKLFGKPYSVLKVDFDKEKSETIKQFGKNPSLVKVFGFKTAGMCSKFEIPKILLLPGEGEVANDCGYENDAEVKMWKVDSNFNSLQIEASSINMSELLDVTIDKGLSLSVKLKNCSYRGGIFRGVIEVKIDVFGIRITENINVEQNIGVSNTINVYSGNLGPFYVTVDLTLKSITKACARITAEYFGMRANEEVCATF